MNGLDPNMDKSAWMLITVDGKRKICYQDMSDDLDLGSVVFRKVPPTEFVKYLGVQYGVFGKRKFDQVLLVPQLANLTRAPLKPQQRLFVLINYLLPRYFPQLVLGKFYLKAVGTIHKLFGNM